jgi:hypothetical protein
LAPWGWDDENPVRLTIEGDPVFVPFQKAVFSALAATSAPAHLGAILARRSRLKGRLSSGEPEQIDCRIWQDGLPALQAMTIPPVCFFAPACLMPCTLPTGEEDV